MRSKALVIGMLGATVLCSWALAQQEGAHHGHHASSETRAAAAVPKAKPSSREVVSVNRDEYDHVLGDMNQMLATLGQINQALSQQDMATVRKLADALRPQHTMQSQDPASVSFHAKLPSRWREFGRPMHQGFARMADQAARPDVTVAQIQALMAQTTQYCVACHSTYRLHLNP
ncbi:cytochrome c [Ideonella sp.]|jgi:cytochrome c556|uniref:cytochrome c n=1 Tax=Ideonella sp. TaxID=1929293 RepID=UPI0037C11FCD